MSEAVIYGVGVGVGDPEMMTLKAVRVLESADVICLPRLKKEECRAYNTAVQVVPGMEEKEILCFDFEMTRDKEKLLQKHKEIFEKTMEQVNSRKAIAFLTIGDPTVYSTFSYVAGKARENGIRVRVINGVTSFCASAASLGTSLCDGDEELHVYPGIDHSEEALKTSGTKVFMKCGRGLGKLKEKLLLLEKEYQSKNKKLMVTGVSECSLPEEELFFGAENLPEDGRYLITVIVKEG